jgi:hypothetical protein
VRDFNEINEGIAREAAWLAGYWSVAEWEASAEAKAKVAEAAVTEAEVIVSAESQRLSDLPGPEPEAEAE